MVLVDTIPKDARNQGSINVGLEIVSKMTGARVVSWYDKTPIEDDVIAFNILYPTHLLNISPFLRNHNIEPLSYKRKGIKLIAGGPGIGNGKALKDIVDEVYHGEYDYNHNQTSVLSEPIIKGGKAVIELTRGCKYKCKFCEYTYNVKPYREKPLSIAIEQIQWIRSKGIKRVNFLSANLAGYSEIGELISACSRNGITILNSDSCIKDLHNIVPHLDILPKQIKLGVESFNEETRMAIGKGVNDGLLLDTVEMLADKLNAIHFYLIYGLPDDNYFVWAEWVRIMADIRKSYTTTTVDLFGNSSSRNTKNLRFEFSITNFEPCYNTPMSDAPEVCFEEKAEFVEMWGEVLMQHGFFAGEEYGYKNSGGRLGRKELSYKLLMELKRGIDVRDKLLYALPNGVGRSISDKEAESFLSMISAVVIPLPFIR